MAHYYNAAITFKGKAYRFNRFLGVLTCSSKGSRHSHTIKAHLALDKVRCLDAITNPFLMKPSKMKEVVRQKEPNKKARLWAKILTWLCAHCYPFAYLCSRLRLNLFDNAGEASQFYYSVYPSFKRQRMLCLPRAIFIATTSRRFKKHGMMFIGAFLPTVRMHAWVIEDGSNPDVYDNQWICFQPVMMMT